MADLEMQLGNFVPNGRGIVEVWQSQDMQAALAELADSLCDTANSMGHIHGTNNKPLYESGVDVADRTAIGYVRTSGLGIIDQAAHHTLDALNH